jgi:cytochrome c-type biogenesis protein CcmH
MKRYDGLAFVGWVKRSATQLCAVLDRLAGVTAGPCRVFAASSDGVPWKLGRSRLARCASGFDPAYGLGAVILFAMVFAVPARAVEPDEILGDAKMEARARVISTELRCLVCQNQSIDDSHAPLARDLRLLVRERLKAGDSDAAVLGFVVERYGEFVLLRPPFIMATLLLWLGPTAMLLLTMTFLVIKVRRDRDLRDAKTPPLSETEKARLAALLSDERPTD